MDVVWSAYDIFYSRSVCIKAPSIYVIMAHVARRTGLKLAKIYENSTVYWYGVPKKVHLVDVANHTDRTWTKGLYIICKVSEYSVYTSTVFNGVYTKQGRLD